jgi:hypothetical protein
MTSGQDRDAKLEGFDLGRYRSEFLKDSFASPRAPNRKGAAGDTGRRGWGDPPRISEADIYYATGEATALE